jgi:hyaluronoglucosaminidase
MTPLVGVIEGFYGRPWSWAEREATLRWLSPLGFNFYFQAPKNDPLHRNRWREPYHPVELDRFGRLVRVARGLGIELHCGVSPLGFRYEDGTDGDLLWAKFEAFLRVGVRSFGILFDDMPAGSPDLQAGLVNHLAGRLRQAGATRVSLTPTEYHGDGRSTYLERLGRQLDPAIDVLWTGPAVCSREISAAHLRRVATALRRPVIVWDNYPVNDLDMRFDPHLGPLRGRDADCWREVRGFAWAASPAARLSRVALHTAAAFARAPAAYRPEAAWRRALEAVAGPRETARALALLGDLTRHSPLERGEAENTFTVAARRFWHEWEAGRTAVALDLIDAELFRLRTAAERLRRALDRALARDLSPWIEKLQGWVAVGEAALDTLRTGQGAAEVISRIWRVRENFHRVIDDQMDAFARRCLAEAGGAARPARSLETAVE